jgi:HK97 family phage prohead protease
VRFEGDGLTFEGYAAVFDSPTRISGWEGDFFETIKRGAFAKSIAERTPVLQFDHGAHPLVGSIPLGVISSIKEDGRGLFVRARLSNNWLVEPVRDAIRDGAIDGMSFRFNVIRDEWDMDTDPVPTRTLLEVRTPEVGPVVFPAYEATTAGVRSRQAEQIVAAIRDADETTRRDLAALLAFDPPSITDAADTGTESTSDAADTGTSLDDVRTDVDTSVTDTGTPPDEAPAVDHLAAFRRQRADELAARVAREARELIDRKDAIHG